MNDWSQKLGGVRVPVVPRIMSKVVAIEEQDRLRAVRHILIILVALSYSTCNFIRFVHFQMEIYSI